MKNTIIEAFVGVLLLFLFATVLNMFSWGFLLFLVKMLS